MGMYGCLSCKLCVLQKLGLGVYLRPGAWGILPSSSGPGLHTFYFSHTIQSPSLSLAPTLSLSLSHMTGPRSSTPKLKHTRHAISDLHKFLCSFEL